jgi:uncharacterized protein YhdP
VLANSLNLETPHGAAHASVELTAGPEFEAPTIDLNGSARFKDVAELPRYLPKILPVSVIEWLDKGLLGGTIPRATVKLTGPLKNFPYVDGSGEFLIKVNVLDGALDYAPDWPNLTDVDGQIVFDKVSLYSLRNSLTTGDINLQQLEVRMKDMRNGILTVNGAGQADFSNILAFMQVSPVGEALGPVFDDVYGEGGIEADMELVLPIQDTDNWQFDARFNARNITTGLAGVDPHFTNLTGKGSVHNTQVTMPEASATLLGDPVSIAVRPAGEGEVEFSHLADVTGTLQVPLVWDAFGQPPVGLFGGTVLLDMQALFPVMDPVMDDAEVLPFRVLVSTDLAGVTSKVPYPFNKTAEDLELMQAEAQFPEEGIIDVTGSLERGFIWTMQMHDMGEADGGWMIERGALTRDATPPPLPDEPGVLVSAYLDAADLDAWVEAFEFDDIELDAEFADWQQRFSLIDLQIGELDALLHRFPDVDLRARPLASKWDVELAGPWTEGRVIIPFDYLSDDVFEIDMQRVLLLEPLDDDGDSEIDPRTQPAIKGRIEEFSLGTMQFGALELEVERIENGLKTVVVRTTAESFTTESSSDWIVVDNAQRTRFHSELRSTDFKETLRDLDYSPMVSAKRATVITDLLWEGQPGMAMVYESTGQVRLTIRDGVVDEVDAGGGRLLGLLSVTALPRRLSLDFRELTNSGLIFDKISGTFKIDFGNAWTCDLGLEGDMADMGMVGRTGMLVEDYDQVAAVRPHVSNVAPVAGAFLAGPVVGAAALLITQIFKKPLSNVGGSYFTLTGSWDEPLVTPVERSEIDTNRFSDCEQQLPEMSPEGIRALDELMNKEPKEPTTPPLELQLPPIFPATEPDSESGSESAAEAPVEAG